MLGCPPSLALCLHDCQVGVSWFSPVLFQVYPLGCGCHVPLQPCSPWVREPAMLTAFEQAASEPSSAPSTGISQLWRADTSRAALSTGLAFVIQPSRYLQLQRRVWGWFYPTWLGWLLHNLAALLLQDTTVSPPRLHFAKWNKPNSSHSLFHQGWGARSTHGCQSCSMICHGDISRTLQRLAPLVPLAGSTVQARPHWISDARQGQPWAWEGG